MCRTKESTKAKAGDDAPVYHDGCGELQPQRYVLQDKLTVQVEFLEDPETGADRKRPMSAEEVMNVLKGISANDCDIMGFVACT